MAREGLTKGMFGKAPKVTTPGGAKGAPTGNGPRSPKMMMDMRDKATTPMMDPMKKKPAMPFKKGGMVKGKTKC